MKENNKTNIVYNKNRILIKEIENKLILEFSEDWCRTSLTVKQTKELIRKLTLWVNESEKD